MGPNPDITLGQHGQYQYDPWLTEVPAYRCPSDPGEGLPGQGRTNYGVCTGDAIQFQNTGFRRQNGTVNNTVAPRAKSTCRGMFFPRNYLGFRDTLDGLSNTIMAGEMNTDLGDNHVTTRAARGGNMIGLPSRCGVEIPVDPERPQFWPAGTTYGSGAQTSRGLKWASGYNINTGITTISPPNSPICTHNGNGSWRPGIHGPSSRHQGGVHVLMGDGAVRFVTDSIESGNQRQAQVIWNGNGIRAPGSKSPYGLWGALGTRANREIIDQEI